MFTKSCVIVVSCLFLMAKSSASQGHKTSCDPEVVGSNFHWVNSECIVLSVKVHFEGNK